MFLAKNRIKFQYMTCHTDMYITGKKCRSINYGGPSLV